jgi:hypothetical protein
MSPRTPASKKKPHLHLSHLLGDGKTHSEKQAPVVTQWACMSPQTPTTQKKPHLQFFLLNLDETRTKQRSLQEMYPKSHATNLHDIITSDSLSRHDLKCLLGIYWRGEGVWWLRQDRPSTLKTTRPLQPPRKPCVSSSLSDKFMVGWKYDFSPCARNINISYRAAN